MTKLLTRLVLNGIALFVVGYLFDGITIVNSALLPLTILFTILNYTLKPILKILSLPLTILSIGLFGIIINGVVFFVACQLIDGVALSGFGEAIMAGIVLAVLNAVTYRMFDVN